MSMNFGGINQSSATGTRPYVSLRQNKMKKTIVLLLIVVSLALNVFLLIVNYRLKAVLNNSIQDTATLKNVISLVDTLYGR